MRDEFCVASMSQPCRKAPFTHISFTECERVCCYDYNSNPLCGLAMLFGSQSPLQEQLHNLKGLK